jgi:SAM-dependent methyltransferase
LSEPPLKEENDSFDLIYAISVLTHLNETHQDLWLAEWKRLLKPGGVLIATFRSEEFLKQFIQPRSPEYADKLLGALSANGFAHVTDEGWAGVFPNFYNDSFHTPDYVKARWGRELDVVGIYPPAVFPGSRQDVAVLRKGSR